MYSRRRVAEHAAQAGHQYWSPKHIRLHRWGSDPQPSLFKVILLALSYMQPNLLYIF